MVILILDTTLYVQEIWDTCALRLVPCFATADHTFRFSGKVVHIMPHSHCCCVTRFQVIKRKLKCQKVNFMPAWCYIVTYEPIHYGSKNNTCRPYIARHSGHNGLRCKNNYNPNTAFLNNPIQTVLSTFTTIKARAYCFY